MTFGMFEKGRTKEDRREGRRRESGKDMRGEERLTNEYSLA